jgi:hypothetical protein
MSLAASSCPISCGHCLFRKQIKPSLIPFGLDDVSTLPLVSSPSSLSIVDLPASAPTTIPIPAHVPIFPNFSKGRMHDTSFDVRQAALLARATAAKAAYDAHVAAAAAATAAKSPLLHVPSSNHKKHAKRRAAAVLFKIKVPRSTLSITLPAVPEGSMMGKLRHKTINDLTSNVANKISIPTSQITIPVIPSASAAKKVFALKSLQMCTGYLGPVSLLLSSDGTSANLRQVISIANRALTINVIDATATHLDPLSYDYSIPYLNTLPTYQVNLRDNLNLYLALLLSSKYYFLATSQPWTLEAHLQVMMRDPIALSYVRTTYPTLLQVMNRSRATSYRTIRHQVLIKMAPIDALYNAVNYFNFIYTKTGSVGIAGQTTFHCLVNVRNLDNAFWTGSYMVFGNGESEFNPLTSIDVVGHELTHGYIQGVKDLTYQGESGGLNESIADMYGSSFEFYMYSTFHTIDGSANWNIAEVLDMTTEVVFLRSMSNPEAGQQPSTYGGQYWVDPSSQDDDGGVHTNSGVTNKVYYLMASQGNLDEAIRVITAVLNVVSINCTMHQFAAALVAVTSSIHSVIVNACVAANLYTIPV